VDRVHDQRRVHDRAIDNGLGRELLHSDAQEMVLALLLLKLDELEGRTADIQTDYAFGS
jgi:hypothetical protein